ncbi:MAG: carboxypeptidase-like regulatory domain-containing protein, partial [Vicinamibacterales bacterium]
MATKRESGASRIADMPVPHHAVFRLASRRAPLALLGTATVLLAMPRVNARQAGVAVECRIQGRITGEALPLPGVAIVLHAGEAVVAATSTDVDGTYRVPAAPGAYRLSIELTGFTPVRREISVDAGACAQTLDVQLTLLARRPRTGASASATRARTASEQPPRFETLALQEQSAGALAAAAPPDRDAEEAAARQLLPPGFSNEAQAQTLSFSGNTANVDRGMLGERLDALGRGEFDPASGELPPGFGTGPA